MRVSSRAFWTLSLRAATGCSKAKHVPTARWRRSRAPGAPVCLGSASGSRCAGPRYAAHMTISAVGILSPGDMGSGVGTVLHQHGLRVLTCLSGRGEGSRDRAARGGFEDLPDLEMLVREA